MKRKNLIWLAAILLLSLILVACNGNESASSSNEQDGQVAETAGNSEEESGSSEKSITLYADTINSHTVEDAVCVVNSRFEQGWGMVFRASVTDSDTGEVVEDADVKVVFENGEELEMNLGEHGDNKTLLYTVLWMIPEDFPTGTLNYEIIATVDGVEYVYEPFDVEPSKLTIIEPTQEG